ncbi:MAG: hypothetical protein UR94_C0026G0001, partial [Parcubacteria group bacterium GW2011_GWA2_36_10]
FLSSLKTTRRVTRRVKISRLFSFWLMLGKFLNQPVGLTERSRMGGSFNSYSMTI